MGRGNVQRYQDVNEYISQLEDVYDLSLDVHFPDEVKASTGEIKVVIKGWDKDDANRCSGPLVYTEEWLAPRPHDRMQKCMIRALSEIARQCLELYVSRETLHGLGA